MVWEKRKYELLEELEGAAYWLALDVNFKVLDPIFLVELFLALGLPIVLLIGLNLLFMTDGIPSWVK